MAKVVQVPGELVLGIKDAQEKLRALSQSANNLDIGKKFGKDFVATLNQAQNASQNIEKILGKGVDQQGLKNILSQYYQIEDAMKKITSMAVSSGAKDFIQNLFPADTKNQIRAIDDEITKLKKNLQSENQKGFLSIDSSLQSLGRFSGLLKQLKIDLQSLSSENLKGNDDILSTALGKVGGYQSTLIRSQDIKNQILATQKNKGTTKDYFSQQFSASNLEGIIGTDLIKSIQKVGTSGSDVNVETARQKILQYVKDYFTALFPTKDVEKYIAELEVKIGGLRSGKGLTNAGAAGSPIAQTWENIIGSATGFYDKEMAKESYRKGAYGPKIQQAADLQGIIGTAQAANAAEMQQRAVREQAVIPKIDLKEKEKISIMQTAYDAFRQSIINGSQGAQAAVLGLNGSFAGMSDEIERMSRSQETGQFLDSFTARFFSMQAVVNYVRQAIQNVISTIKELDSQMNEIAVVTNMTTDDLWKQIDVYTQLAQTYGVSIKGAYEVSTLYYQMGLQTNDVLAATSETLKMARIASMGYSEATDAMTVALRAFNIEYADAGRIADVYSKVAAISASNTQELATAMSKVGAQAGNVGMSFENTTAMLATMINNSVPCAA